MIDWSATVVGPCVKVFGEPATYQYQGSETVYPLKAIFDDAYKLMKTTEYGPELLGTFPAAGIDLADLPYPPKQGDTFVLTRTGQEYTVRVPGNDSHGGCMLVLNRVAS